MLVSALISPRGLPARVLAEWVSGSFDLLVSPRLLEELDAALARPRLSRYVPRPDARSFIADLRRPAKIVADPSQADRLVPDDPRDDFLVALAVAARADVLVSGDRHLLELRDPPPPMLSPRAFLAQLERHG